MGGAALLRFVGIVLARGVVEGKRRRFGWGKGLGRGRNCERAEHFPYQANGGRLVGRFPLYVGPLAPGIDGIGHKQDFAGAIPDPGILMVTISHGAVDNVLSDLGGEVISV
jgi:hypothetical protein